MVFVQTWPIQLYPAAHSFRKTVMILKRAGFIVLVSIFWHPFLTDAGDFDGTIPLRGSVDKVIEMNRFAIKNDVSPDAIGLPRRFTIDFKANVVRPSNDSMVRKIIKIHQVEHVENKLVLQGIDDGVENVDDGLAWSLVISKKTGTSILSASGDGVAYVVFGRCIADK
jgi:hypothetical protein